MLSSMPTSPDSPFSYPSCISIFFFSSFGWPVCRDGYTGPLPLSSVDIGIPTSHVMSVFCSVMFSRRDDLLVYIAWSLIRITILLDDFLLEYGVGKCVCSFVRGMRMAPGLL